MVLHLAHVLGLHRAVGQHHAVAADEGDADAAVGAELHGPALQVGTGIGQPVAGDRRQQVEHVEELDGGGPLEQGGEHRPEQQGRGDHGGQGGPEGSEPQFRRKAQEPHPPQGLSR